METNLIVLVLLPLLGAFLSLVPDRHQEKRLFYLTATTLGLYLAGLIYLGAGWATGDFRPLTAKGPDLYHSGATHFSLEFMADHIGFLFSGTAGVLTLLVAIFSRYYLHRERGFKRFFNNLLFFFGGVNFIVLAGNFETLFIGWEIIGATSFFLIAFYRDRYLPVKNALKVVSLYRLADVSLLLAIWLMHHVFGRSIRFEELYEGVELHFGDHGYLAEVTIFLLLLLVAMVKSAQFPFSSWLARAIEGPTSSSAIFYGSISVHMGVFLLFRTYPLWGQDGTFKAVVVAVGLLTSLISTPISRVQSTVKAQIAYSSIAQIGLLLVEIAMGWHTLALVHFLGNSFLRTYQFLVSPSVLSYLIHDQFFNFIPPQPLRGNRWLNRIRLSIYVLSLKEWNMDKWQRQWLWNPLKRAGNYWLFINWRWLWVLFTPFFLLGLAAVYFRDQLPPSALGFLPETYSIIALILALRSFVERQSSRIAWGLLLFNQLYTSLSIGLNEQFDYGQIHLFLSGVILCGGIGAYLLHRLKATGNGLSLDRFHGHAFRYPRVALLFAIASLGLSGFPITPTFIGEDLILGHIHENQVILTVLTASNLIIDGLAIFRIYARLFLGPNSLHSNVTAQRAS